jgi:hypothetical protein
MACGEEENVMGNTRDNKFTVHQRLAASEARLTTLEAENKALRTHLLTELKNAVSDTVGQTGATGRDGASVIGPVGPAGKDSNVQGPRGAEGRRGDTGPRGERGEKGEQGIQGLTGAPGKDGASITGPAGPQGPAGDITVYGDAELQAAVTAMRIKLKEQHAKFIAALVEAAAGQAKGNPYPGKHFAKLLESIRADIERLK